MRQTVEEKYQKKVIEILEKKKLKSKLSEKESFLLNDLVSKRDQSSSNLFNKEVKMLEMLHNKQENGDNLDLTEKLLLNTLKQTYSEDLKKD